MRIVCAVEQTLQARKEIAPMSDGGQAVNTT
jgi:hypothetical protein